jgi:hypothetical protein
MPTAHPLLKTKSPWVHLLTLASGQTASSVLQPPPGLLVHELDGADCVTKARLLAAFAGAFAFPDYFDPNWDAFEECLCDLDWQPAEGYLLIIHQAHLVLGDSPTEWNTFVSILQSVGKHWGTKQPDRPGRPFHTVFVGNRTRRGSRKNWRIPAWKPR